MQFQVIEILFTQGLDEKLDPRSVRMGRLTRADNVEFDKFGALNKRRGFISSEIGTELFGATMDQYLMHLAKHEDELLILGADHLYSMVDPDNGTPGTRAVVERGPIPRGNIRRQDVATAHTGKDTNIIPQ